MTSNIFSTPLMAKRSLVPPEGPRQFVVPPITVNGTNGTQASFDISGSGMASIRSAFVDNSESPWTLSIQIGDSRQMITVPPMCTLITPWLTNSLQQNLNLWAGSWQSNANAPAPGSTPLVIPITLYNFDQEYSLSDNKSTPPLQYNGGEFFQYPTTTTTTALTGVWKQVLAGNNSRTKYIVSIGSGITATGNWQIGFGDGFGNGPPAAPAVFNVGYNNQWIEEKKYPGALITTSSVWVLQSVVASVGIEATEWGY